MTPSASTRPARSGGRFPQQCLPAFAQSLDVNRPHTLLTKDDWDTPILLRLSNNPLRFTACALPWLLASILQGVERTELGLGLAKPNKPGSKRSAVG